MEDHKHLMQLGIQHLENGNLTEAAAVLETILQDHPRYDDALQLLGLTLFRQGKIEQGIQLFREALQVNPQNIRARNNLACVLRDLGRLQEASAEFQQLYLLAPEDQNICSNLAIVLNDLGHPDEALRFSTEALTLAPRWAQAHRVHGLVLKSLGELDNAKASLEKALDLEPDNPEFQSNLCSILIEQEDYEAAEKIARHALSATPDRADLHHNLGVALARQYFEWEAAGHLEQAIKIDPSNAKAYCDLAATSNDLGNLDRAMLLYREALDLDHDLPIAKFGLGILQLTKGDFSNGWQNYEARKTAREIRSRPEPLLAPRWNGEPLKDKRILLYAEQGYGDILQFVRFVPELIKQGAIVSLEVYPELTGLLGSCEWPIDFVTLTEAKHEQYDFECALLSIPRAVNLQIGDLPIASSYLKANQDKRAYWQEKFSDPQRLRIGLCWAGSSTHKNDHNRSIAADAFSRLCTGIDADFVCLQKEIYENELSDFATNGIRLLNWSDEFFNFAETAALIDCLDLVISVDTVITHLAAGLGKQTWTLLPFIPDWRWLLDRSDSPWYPSMKLFRQPVLGNWDVVLSQVADELKVLTNTRKA